jgi:hypothetical protein
MSGVPARTGVVLLEEVRDGPLHGFAVVVRVQQIGAEPGVLGELTQRCGLTVTDRVMCQLIANG